MKPTNLFLTTIFTISLIATNDIFSLETIQFEEALWSQVQALSASDFKKTSKEDIKDHKDWKKTIDAIFQKLKTNSGNPNFETQYAILKDNSFNAFAFPGGQFIIHTELLDEMDRLIQSQTGSKPNSKEANKFRELYLAPVIAHELGHYYNRHSFKSYLAKIEKKNTKEEKEESRELELDADMSGVLLMQKAGYDVTYFTKMLKILNGIRKKELKTGDKNIPYFQTHPSPNERLSKIESEHKDLYVWAAKMEYVFADIQISKNLENAIQELDNALNLYPDNLDFQKAKVVALHKIWLESALVDELKLKSIVDLPSFQDNMVFDKKATKKATKTIPGDKVKFNKALTAYRNFIEENQEPWFVSNFSVLLVYSPEKKDEANAIKLARSAFKTQPSVQTLNNLGVCLSIAVLEGDSKLSREIFREIAQILDPNVGTFLKNQSKNKEAISLAKDLQKVLKNKEETEEDISAVILNFALHESSSSKDIVKFYFSNYDSNSKWADFLSKMGNTPIPKKLSEENTIVDGIKLGSSIKELLSTWKEPDRKPKLEDGFEIWYYDKKSAKIYMRDGFVLQILLYGEDSPTVLGVKIGSEKSLVEKTLGKNYKKQNRYLIYEKKEKLGLTIEDNKVEKVLIFD